MGLPHKDVHVRFDADYHQAAELFAQIDGKSIVGWCEDVLKSEIKRRMHLVILANDEIDRRGIAGIARDIRGLGDPR